MDDTNRPCEPSPRAAAGTLASTSLILSTSPSYLRFDNSLTVITANISAESPHGGNWQADSECTAAAIPHWHSVRRRGVVRNTTAWSLLKLSLWNDHLIDPPGPSPHLRPSFQLCQCASTCVFSTYSGYQRRLVKVGFGLLLLAVFGA